MYLLQITFVFCYLWRIRADALKPAAEVGRKLSNYLPTDIQGKLTIVDSFPISVNSLDFGTGYNSITLRRTYNSPVRSTTVRLASPRFVECKFRLKLCENRAEFFSAIGGGVSASASYMGVEGSSSTKFITQSKITVLDSVLVATVDVITETKTISKPAFTTTSLKFLQQGQFYPFVELYGTHYLHTAILGGKMILIMKFTSSTLDTKHELDIKLSAITGDFKAESEFRVKLEAIQQFSKMEMSLFAQGGVNPPPEPDIRAGIEYALAFSESVKKFPAVKEMEYVALWTLDKAPLAFKHFVFPIQGQTDTIVRIAIELYEAQAYLIGLQEMKERETKYISIKGWEEVKRLKNVVEELLRKIQNTFRTSPINEFGDIIAQFQGAGGVYKSIEDLLEEEQRYVVPEKFFLRSYGYNRYISTDENDCPRLDSRAPIGLYLVGPHKDVKYGGIYHYSIKSDTKPGQVLCMLKSRWQIYWASPPNIDSAISQCMWRLVHSRDQHKKNFGYGDTVLFYNKAWPNYIMGANEDGTNLYSVGDDQVWNNRHHWVVDKTQFQ